MRAQAGYLRPVAALDRDLFTANRAEPDGVELAYLREGAGGFPLHFLMWERARVLNRAIGAFCRDLLPQSGAP